jgi:uncharacterized BrkB/YihY/UPF0761 family membrane protein
MRLPLGVTIGWRVLLTRTVKEIVETAVLVLPLSFHVTNFGQCNQMYGAIGGVIVMLLWFDLSGLVLLIGAEFNSALGPTERAQFVRVVGLSPDGNSIAYVLTHGT